MSGSGAILLMKNLNTASVKCASCRRSASVLGSDTLIHGTKDGWLCDECVDWPRYRREHEMYAKRSVP